MVGSIPRLVIAAFIARAIATSEGETSNMATDDLRAYFKYRRSCGFTQLDKIYKWTSLYPFSTFIFYICTKKVLFSFFNDFCLFNTNNAINCKL